MDKIELKSKLNQLNKKANVILENLENMDNQTKPLMINEMSNIMEELESLTTQLQYLEGIDGNDE